MSRIPWDKITQKLMDKWGGGAPRYTSYPTALEWQSTYGKDQFHNALLKADQQTEDPISIYIHIPFCKKRCLFCGCASDISDDNARYDTYLDAVGAEIAAAAARLPHRKKVAGLHMGGGTPTVLDGSRLQHLVSQVARHFDLSGVKEMALEAAPSVTSIDQVDILGMLGFNRLSVGVQDFSETVQKAVDRVQSPTHTAALIEQAKSYDMGINIDLMYGLPYQSIATWKQTLNSVVEISPDRLAVFGYAHVPWMRPHQKQLDEQTLPNGPARLALFRTAHEHLTDAGYIYVGMDHFAKPTDPLVEALHNHTLWRNFQGYTLKQSSILLGFGATAISDLGSVFAQNAVSTDAYQTAAHSGLATFRGHISSTDDQLRRFIITELMCNLTLDVAKTERRFSINFWDYFSNEKNGLEQLAADQLIEFDSHTICVTPLGRLFVRHVGLVFDCYSKKRLKQSKFSRTV